jgi:hypothetical protein
MQVTDFAKKQPTFDAVSYFSGRTTGHGLFYDRSANVSLSFVVELEGHVEDSGVLVLNETLTYDDGTVSHRTFRLEPKGESGGFVLHCDDLTEPGEIEQAGNALRWSYTLLQDVGGTKRPLRFDDWMFRKTEQLVLNRARAFWHGIFVGEVFMVIEKQQG